MKFEYEPIDITKAFSKVDLHFEAAEEEQTPPLTTDFKTIDLEVTFLEVNPERLAAVVSGRLPTEGPTHSLETWVSETISGEPLRPTQKKGLWAWLTRANRKAERAWKVEHDEWVAAGRPDKEIFHYALYPSVTITEVEQEESP